MPQLEKGGKFIYGWSIINDDYTVQIPKRAVEEYNISNEGKIFLFSSSKTTGGFCITKNGLLYPSKIGNILKDNPKLMNFTLKEGQIIQYKGRLYCWVSISKHGLISLQKNIMEAFELTLRMKLLSIRSSDIAITMGAKGPLLEIAHNYNGIIEEY